MLQEFALEIGIIFIFLEVQHLVQNLPEALELRLSNQHAQNLAARVHVGQQPVLLHSEQRRDDLPEVGARGQIHWFELRLLQVQEEFVQMRKKRRRETVEIDFFVVHCEVVF